MIRQNYNTFDIHGIFSHNMAEGFSQSLDIFRNGQYGFSVIYHHGEKISATYLLGTTVLHSTSRYFYLPDLLGTLRFAQPTMAVLPELIEKLLEKGKKSVVVNLRLIYGYLYGSI